MTPTTCIKCGNHPATRAVWCPTCRWLLRLAHSVAPHNIVELGLPPGRDYDIRQTAERIPNSTRVEQWPEIS